MPETGRRGSPDGPRRNVMRRGAIALLACAHMALAGFVPALDAPLPSTNHQHHVAAQDAGACQAYHDEHCALCRVASSDPAASAPDAGLVSAPPTAGAQPRSVDRGVPHPSAFSTLHPRAPPAA